MITRAVFKLHDTTFDAARPDDMGSDGVQAPHTPKFGSDMKAPAGGQVRAGARFGFGVVVLMSFQIADLILVIFKSFPIDLE